MTDRDDDIIIAFFLVGAFALNMGAFMIHTGFGLMTIGASFMTMSFVKWYATQED